MIQTRLFQPVNLVSLSTDAQRIFFQQRS